MKGIFIPEITVEMFRSGCLESIEELMAEGEVYDIEYDPKSAQPEIIRCKECKYGAPNGVYGCRLERFLCFDDSVRMYGEDFCSMGEQKGRQNE